MTERNQFIDEDLTGARFRRVDLTDSAFHEVTLDRSTWREMSLDGIVGRGLDLIDLDLYGWLGKVVINGVDVVPLVETELDRRYPDRAAMRPDDAEGFRRGWDVVERLWAGTIGRARGRDPALLDVSVGGEWPFLMTLRHLVFATESWVSRAILGAPPRGTRCRCHGPRCPTPQEFRVILRPDRPWTRCSRCATTAWR